MFVSLLWLASNIGPVVVDGWYRERHEGRSLFATKWSVLHLWWALQAIFVVLLLLTGSHFVLLGALSAPLHFSEKHLTDSIAQGNIADPRALILFFLPATVLQNIAFFIVPAAIIAGIYRQRLRSIGLTLIPPRRAVIAGTILGIFVFGFMALIDSGLEKLAGQFHHLPVVARMLHYEQTNPVAQMANTLHRAGWAGLFWGIMAVAIAAPLGEEMLFRGFVLNVLVRRFGEQWGLVLSAILFAAPHTYSPIGLTVVFLMGLILGHIYRTGGSLWTTIFIHSVSNGAQILIAFFAMAPGK